MTTRSLTGRAWAYTGATLGGAVSIAANVAHPFIPPADAAADWTPEPIPGVPAATASMASR